MNSERLALSKSGVMLLRAAASRAHGAPALCVMVGAAAALIGRLTGAPTAPSEWTAASATALLCALVFAAAAQLRISQLAVNAASFRLTVGAGPLYLLVCMLTAFILLPQLTLPAAVLLGATLMLNGGAFDMRAVTNAPAPAGIKRAVRAESAAIIALGAPIAVLAAGFATTPASGDAGLAPLLDASVAAFCGFSIGGGAGLLAARWRGSILSEDSPARAAFAATLAALLAAAIGADPVVAAGAAGLIWGEESRVKATHRRIMRRRAEQTLLPAAYILFGLTVAPRLLHPDLLTVLFAAAAATILRAGPRLAVLQGSGESRECRHFLAWFGGAPGAASALFLVSLVDNYAIAELEAVLSAGAFAIAASVVAARLTFQPLVNHFLRQWAFARRRRLFPAE